MDTPQTTSYAPGQVFSPPTEEITNDAWGPMVIESVDEGYFCAIVALPMNGSFRVVRIAEPVYALDAYLASGPSSLQGEHQDINAGLVQILGLANTVEGYEVSWDLDDIPQPSLRPVLGSVEVDHEVEAQRPSALAHDDFSRPLEVASEQEVDSPGYSIELPRHSS
jgi:hypothetical protein